MELHSALVTFIYCEGKSIVARRCSGLSRKAPIPRFLGGGEYGGGSYSGLQEYEVDSSVLKFVEDGAQLILLLLY